MSAAPKRVTLVGGTGLIGRQLLDLLLADGHMVQILVRRPVGVRHARLVEQVASVEEWPGLVAAARPDVVISCLGTTRKQAGSDEAFRAVDQHLVVAVMQAARDAGARQAMTISSVGANPSSGNFYLRVKGEVERSLGDMGFNRLDIIRPGLLRGERSGAPRLAERVGIALSPLSDAVLGMAGMTRYRSIGADRVAQAMARLVGAQKAGEFLHENDEILRLA